MKKIKTLCLVLQLLCAGISLGQNDTEVKIPFDSITRKFAYSRIVEVPGKSAAELFAIVKKWSVQKFMDGKFLYEEADAQLIDLGNFPITVVVKAGGRQIPFSYTIIYNLSVQFKPGRCKIVTTDIKLSQNAKGTSNEQPLESYKKNMSSMKGVGSKKAKGMEEDTFREIDLGMRKTLADLEKNLRGEAGSDKDW